MGILDASAVMKITLDRMLLRAFWERLYDNISFSPRYGKFVIVEPAFSLEGKGHVVSTVRSLDALAFEGKIGQRVVDFIGDITMFSNGEEQALLPYVTDNNCK